MKALKLITDIQDRRIDKVSNIGEKDVKKVAFMTLGCKVNQYETEAMEELFLR